MGILRLGTVLLSVQLGLEALALSTGKLFSRYDSKHIVNETVCDHGHYQYRGLAGYGLIPSNARDKFGDTIGGIGSAIALERKSWKKTKGGDYTGILWGLTDRGWYDPATVRTGLISKSTNHLQGIPKEPSITKLVSISFV